VLSFTSYVVGSNVSTLALVLFLVRAHYRTEPKICLTSLSRRRLRILRWEHVYPLGHLHFDILGYRNLPTWDLWFNVPLMYDVHIFIRLQCYDN